MASYVFSVVRSTDADIAANVAIGPCCRVEVAGLLDRLVGDLHQESLLRIHGCRLSRCLLEELMVESIVVVEEVSVPRLLRVVLAEDGVEAEPVTRHRLVLGFAFYEKLPELVRVVGPGDMDGQTHHSNLVGGALRECYVLKVQHSRTDPAEQGRRNALLRSEGEHPGIFGVQVC
ncbi:hypothetical protein MPH_11433 [Macrophomina phaseolina MS6]|uniref:Uncharacterized protein n=1 Tax=Macrophomina phaseolina (strain MS6) TaxID=1126212 RepID=K2RAB5_MACPH|nr:hypothetical protein MPH_11433 [Macrophomina phaseolina MS6]